MTVERLATCAEAMLPSNVSYARGHERPGRSVSYGELSADGRDVVAYHERTKYSDDSSLRDKEPRATSGQISRRYAGAATISLPPNAEWQAPQEWEFHLPGTISAAPLSLDTLGIFFRRAVFHSTESYAFLPEMLDGRLPPSVYHYAAIDRTLEQRAEVAKDDWQSLSSSCPSALFLVGLSSIHRQEMWMLGERGFRAAQHEIGQALAELRMGAASLGWRVSLLPGTGDAALGALLGLDRDDDFAQAERESPNLLVAVSAATSEPSKLELEALASKLAKLTLHSWAGLANPLSAHPGVSWPVLQAVTRATAGVGSNGTTENFSGSPDTAQLYSVSCKSGGVGVNHVQNVPLRARTMASEAFFHLLGRLVPTWDRQSIPWDTIAWRPRIHLALFVHRVEGVKPGLYLLCRDPEQVQRLREATGNEAECRNAPHAPDGLDFFLLRVSDCRSLAARVRGDDTTHETAAFNVLMISDYMDSLITYGAPFYRNLLWEAGMVTQVLRSEVGRAGLVAIGSDAYHDDLVHEAFGMVDREWQCLYHVAIHAPATLESTVEGKRAS